MKEGFEKKEKILPVKQIIEHQAELVRRIKESYNDLIGYDKDISDTKKHLLEISDKKEEIEKEIENLEKDLHVIDEEFGATLIKELGSKYSKAQDDIESCNEKVEALEEQRDKVVKNRKEYETITREIERTKLEKLYLYNYLLRTIIITRD